MKNFFKKLKSFNDLIELERNNYHGEDLSFQQFIKRGVLLFSLLLLIIFGLIIIRVHHYMDTGMYLYVDKGGGGNVQLQNSNYYYGGSAVELHWKPQSYTEGILLDAFSGKKHLDVLDIVLIGFVLLIIYLISNSIKEEFSFQINSFAKYKYLVLGLFFYTPIVDLIKLELAPRYIEYVTSGKFSTQYQTYDFDASVYTLFVMLIPLYYYFLGKASKLQQEAELTI